MNAARETENEVIRRIGSWKFAVTWTEDQWFKWGDNAGYPRPPQFWMPEMITRWDAASECEVRETHWRTPGGNDAAMGYVLSTPEWRREGRENLQGIMDKSLRCAVWYTGQQLDAHPKIEVLR